MVLSFDNLEETLHKEVKAYKKALERVEVATTKKKQAAEEPTWEEAWSKVLNRTKTVSENATNKARALEVKAAVENGEISLDIPSLKKLSWKKVHDTWRLLQESRKDSILKEMVKKTPSNYKLIQSEVDLDQLIADLTHETIVAFDTETTGLDVYSDVIVGLSITLPKADYHVYVPMAHAVVDRQLDRDYVLNYLRPFLESPFIGKVLHNAKFDIHMLLRHGVKMRGLAHDTMVAMHVLNENEKTYALKNLATKYGKLFGFQSESHTYEQLFGKKPFHEVELDVALVYAAKDTHLTWELYQWQLNHLKQRPSLLKIYQEIENPLLMVCVEMEQTGFKIDLEYAKTYGGELSSELSYLGEKLAGYFGEDVNFNSPTQLAAVLYDKLGLEDVNNRSTDESTLKQLKKQHEGVEFLLKYRELNKLLGTYVEALPQLIKADGRIHGSFLQSGTVTGRFASRNPNLQNLPSAARKLIITPDGCLILGSDFSQIEPRILAHMSKDLHFMEPYLKGQDLYSTLAAKVFKKPIEECGDGSDYRKMMKVGLLATMYGTSMWTLAEQLSISVEEAEQFIADFYAAYPEVYQWIKRVWESVKQNEYVETLYGRKRRFPGHREQALVYDGIVEKICKLLETDKVPLDYWNHKKYPQLPYKLKQQFKAVKGDVERVRRMAVNSIIQGSAADIMKRALLNLHEYTQKKGWKVNGTVHDEALLLVSRNITLEEVLELESCMTSAASLDVPLKVDTEIMERWGEGKSKGAWFSLAA